MQDRLKIHKPSGKDTTITFDTTSFLGRGVYGVVYRGRDEANAGQLLAVKRLDSQKTPERRCKREVDIMALFVGYPHIIQLCGSDFAVSGGIYHTIAMSYVAKGRLTDALLTLTTKEQMQVMCGVASGLSYMHREGVLHCDLKTDNILLDGEKPIICDLGLSKRKGIDRVNINDGSLLYFSPELILARFNSLNVGNSEASDIFALSYLFWSVVSRNPFPLEAIDKNGTIATLHDWVVVQNKREPIPPQCPENVAYAITAGWHQKPEMRPSAEQVLTILNPPEVETQMKALNAFGLFSLNKTSKMSISHVSTSFLESEKRAGNAKAQQEWDKQFGLVVHSGRF